MHILQKFNGRLSTAVITMSWNHPRGKRLREENNIVVAEDDHHTAQQQQQQQQPSIITTATTTATVLRWSHQQPSNNVVVRRQELLLVFVKDHYNIRIIRTSVVVMLLMLLLVLFIVNQYPTNHSQSMIPTNTHRQRQRQPQQRQLLQSLNQNVHIGTNRHTNDYNNPHVKKKKKKDRILYIITSMVEYDTGTRSTILGYDRYTNTILPIIIESVQSIVQSTFYHIDVYLITHYTLTTERYGQLRSQLPNMVGLQIWDNAAPYGYVIEDSDTHLQSHTRGLSRQHRYVMKDKIYHYDLFLNFEDDMVWHVEHIQHYVQMTNTIYQLRKESSKKSMSTSSSTSSITTTTTTGPSTTNTTDPTLQFYGDMTEEQLGRTIPGLIRVEVVSTDHSSLLLTYFQNHHLSQRKKLSLEEIIPMDYNSHWDDTANTVYTANHDYNSTAMVVVVDASICCHFRHDTKSTHSKFMYPQQQQQQSNANEPTTNNVQKIILPTANQLYFWEMNIESLGIRHMPPIEKIFRNTSTITNNNNIVLQDLDWVMLLGGNNNEFFIEYDPSYIIGDYWSGRDQSEYVLLATTTTTESITESSNSIHKPIVPNHQQKQRQRPDRRDGKYLNNQGGWIGTRRQIIEWHTRWCRGSFLPPYDPPFYRWDGLDGRSVEYWSGGIQLVGINACNLQRIVALQPEYFSRHLLYHTSNNKQKSVNVQHRFSRRNINEFWGQINTVRKNAERTMKKELEK